MAEPILRIAPKEYSGETMVVPMRLAKELVRDVDITAEETGRNRNDILTTSLEFALHNMEIVIKEKEDK